MRNYQIAVVIVLFVACKGQVKEDVRQDKQVGMESSEALIGNVSQICVGGYPVSGRKIVFKEGTAEWDDHLSDKDLSFIQRYNYIYNKLILD